MFYLSGGAVRDFSQDDHTAALNGTDLLSTRRHLDQRERCERVRGQTDRRSQEGFVMFSIPFRKRHQLVNMSEMSVRSVLRFLIWSRLARHWMEMYWSLSI